MINPLGSNSHKKGFHLRAGKNRFVNEKSRMPDFQSNAFYCSHRKVFLYLRRGQQRIFWQSNSSSFPYSQESVRHLWWARYPKEVHLSCQLGYYWMIQSESNQCKSVWSRFHRSMSLRVQLLWHLHLESIFRILSSYWEVHWQRSFVS